MNEHDLPSVCTLIHYLHACAGFPVRSTWLAAIKAGNFSSWPGLTYTNAAKCRPVSVDTLKGQMTQTRQGACSTKPKPTTKDAPPDLNNQLPTAKAKIFTSTQTLSASCTHTTWVASPSDIAAANTT